MIPRFQHTPERYFAGKKILTSLAKNETGTLWQSFMPLRNSIPDRLSEDLFSIEIYNPDLDFSQFTFQTEFEKWAAMEVDSFNSIHPKLSQFILPAGLHAVFTHVGTHDKAMQAMEYIFQVWLPGSEYLLDSRPHFEVMGAKYKHDTADSEEEFWVPVKRK